MLHRRQLPVISPCDEFVGREATDTDDAFCTRCAKAVHDLSRLREDEVRALVARTGGDLCVSYRVRDDGTVELRPPRRPLAPVALALALAGCAGHVGDGDAPVWDDCEDAGGYRVPCPPRAADGRTGIPGGDAAAPEGTDDDDTSAERPADDPASPSAPDRIAVTESPWDAAEPLDDAPAEIPRVYDEVEPAASCVVTERMRQRERRRRMFVRGKLGPMTDASICEQERWERERAQERRRRR